MIVLAVKNEDLDFGGCSLKGGTEEQSESEAEVFHGGKKDSKSSGDKWPAIEVSVEGFSVERLHHPRVGRCVGIVGEAATVWKNEPADEFVGGGVGPQ
jgi:hypothetical protein